MARIFCFVFVGQGDKSGGGAVVSFGSDQLGQRTISGRPLVSSFQLFFPADSDEIRGKKNKKRVGVTTGGALGIDVPHFKKKAADQSRRTTSDESGR